MGECRLVIHSRPGARARPPWAPSRDDGFSSTAQGSGLKVPCRPGFAGNTPAVFLHPEHVVQDCVPLGRAGPWAELAGPPRRQLHLRGAFGGAEWTVSGRRVVLGRERRYEIR